jgi:hypothetical protein
MWKWLFFLAIFQALLLVPKVTVLIVDRTGNEPPRAVANVPIGLGAFAHMMSKVGDWLTGAFETVFSLPDDVKFRRNGTLFGHRVLAERLAVKSGSPVLTSNLLEFYRECVAPDLATGYIRVKEDLLAANDIWAQLDGRTNPARLVTLRDPADPSQLDTLGCQAAYQRLSRQIAAEASRQVSLLGSRLYPRMTQADAGIAIAGALATSTNYLLGVSAAAQDAVKQAIVANFMIDAQYLLPAQLGDAASAQTNLGMAQSLRSTSDSYKLMARIAESTMPKVRNAIEMVQYAIFPVFLLFVVISGHQAGAVIRAYAASLFWIQLWAPLYAVMNFIITMVSKSQYTSGSAGNGLAIEQMSFLQTAIVSDQAIAGMLVISIPAIAAAIVRGGEVGLQAVAGLVAPPRDPEKIASGLAQGNLQMGNASLNNASHDTLKGLAVDLNPSLRQGMTNYQARGGFDYSHFSGGGFVVRQASSALRANLALNDSLGAAAREHYERSQQATSSALGRVRGKCVGGAAAGSRLRAQPQPGQQRQHRLPARHGFEPQSRGERRLAPGRPMGAADRRQREGGDGADDGRFDGDEHAEAPRDRRPARGGRDVGEAAQFRRRQSLGRGDGAGGERIGLRAESGHGDRQRLGAGLSEQRRGPHGRQRGNPCLVRPRPAIPRGVQCVAAGERSASADVGAVAQRSARRQRPVAGSFHPGFPAAEARFQLRAAAGDSR